MITKIGFQKRKETGISHTTVTIISFFTARLALATPSGVPRPRAVQHRVQRAAGRRADAAAQKTMCRSQEQFLSLSSFLFTRSKEQFLSLSSILCTRSQEHDTFHGVCVCGKSIGLCCLAVLRLAPTTFIKPVLQGWGEVKYKRVGMGRDFVII